ncbi:hypothetical protein JCM3766R1_004345 [Sporobolomyces carnicolor]
MDHLSQRFDHGHYYLNSLLCLAFPAVLASSFSTRSLALLLLAAPLLLSLSVWSRASTDNFEALHASITFQLRLFNLFGFVFSRNQLGTGKVAVAAYLAAWLATSFFYPQPPYLGPKRIQELSSDGFDCEVLLLPPARRASLDSAADPSSRNKIVELSSPEDERDGESAPSSIGPSDRWNLVLFHVEWAKKSRELELTLSRLSYLYGSRMLKFFIITPESAPSTFYDLSLSTSPTSSDLPLVRMYRGGKIVHEEPLSEREARRTRKRNPRRGRDDESQSESEDESDDEREIERTRAMARYKWDRSSAAVERTFKLRERSGLGSSEVNKSKS